MQTAVDRINNETNQLKLFNIPRLIDKNKCPLSLCLSLSLSLSKKKKKFVRPERGHVQRQKVDKKILEIFFVLLDLIWKVKNLDSEIKLNDQNGFCFNSTFCLEISLDDHEYFRFEHCVKMQKVSRISKYDLITCVGWKFENMHSNHQTQFFSCFKYPLPILLP